ncbi:MAG: helix-turn-helix domain-containing protein [Patescibacteria group bacterium]
MNKTHLTLVTELGLSEKEGRVYLAALELGTGSVADIANRAGIKRTSVYNFIDRLIGLGVIIQNTNEPKTYQAVEPKHLARIQQERLDTIKARLPELNALTNLSSTKPRIQYFEGTTQMQQIEREVLNCKKELLVIWNRQRVVEQLGGREYMEELDKLRREKKIHIRLIAVQGEDIKFEGGGGDDTREIRWAPTGMDFPMGISIYDTGKVGLITSQKEKFGILIDSQELEQTLRQMFEAFWQVSKPVKPDTHGV